MGAVATPARRELELVEPYNPRAHFRRRMAQQWAAAGFNPQDPAVRRAARSHGGPPIGGGATGAGGVSFLSNLPADRFQLNPGLFEQSTERQDIPQQSQTFNGFGSNFSVRLQNVGILAMIRCNFSGSLVVSGTGAVTILPGWPYSLFKRVAFNANGQTSLIQVTGPTLRARRNRLFRNPQNGTDLIEAAGGAPGVIANGTYPINFMVDVPISHDMFTGVGWVLAQNPSTYLSLDIACANVADCFSIATGGAVALTGTLFPTITTFAVGQAQAGNGAVTIVPDLTVFHGLLDNTYSFAAAGIVQAPLIRTAGQLVNYAFNLSNVGAEISPLALTEIDFRYGGNRQPRAYNPPSMLVEKNQQDYGGVVNVKGLTYTYLDFEVDNPIRDLFLPEALVELQAQVVIPNTVTVNAGAFLRYVEETLYPAT